MINMDDFGKDLDEIPIELGMFILDGHQVVPATSMREWGRCFMDREKRRVAFTEIGEAHVSTVFLGMDHGWGPMSEGLVFETMVFGAPDGESRTRRYRTWDEAEAGHKKVVEEVEAL